MIPSNVKNSMNEKDFTSIRSTHSGQAVSIYHSLLLLPLLTHAGVGAAVEGLDVLDLDAALGAHRDAGVA